MEMVVCIIIQSMRSFINGGLQSREDLKVDSGASRYAQIMSKENVGDSGYLSRVLGLNNQASRLHPDPNYVCNTQNLLKVTIKNEQWLNRYKGRCFRFTPTGVEYYICSSPLRDNRDLIGKTLYCQITGSHVLLMQEEKVSVISVMAD